jgi:hypothetical protein
MSALTIQKKIDKAHKKIASKLGFQYNLYRSLTDVNPLDDRNHTAVVNATFTLNDTYTQTISDGTPIWTVYTDPIQMEMGDYLYDGVNCYIIISRLPHLPVLAIQANDRIDIRVIGYGDAGTGFGPAQSTYLAKNLPAYVSTSSHPMPVGMPGVGVSKVDFRQMTANTYLKSETNLMNRSLTWNDFTGDIITYDFSSIGKGVKITARESQSV